MSRPRRFGKSLLTSTLKSYFLGERELFEGLKMMEMEKEWEEYPVIHLDLSLAKSRPTATALEAALQDLLSDYEKLYGNNNPNKSPGENLRGLINITKFSQLSIFSTINNLKNVTLLPRFSAICGITEREVKTVFAEDIRRMAEVYGCSEDEMFRKIKERYDGYRFASVSEDIYNPFSLLNAFGDDELNNYWFASGTPTFLIRQMQHFKTDITSLDRLEVPSSSFDQPTENMRDALPLLYQSGYLTIKDYDREGEIYTLAIPNQEVRDSLRMILS